MDYAMNDPYMQFQEQAFRSPQMIQNVEGRNPLASPNGELMSTNDHLKILQQYMRILRKEQMPTEGQVLLENFYGFINSQSMLTFYERQDKAMFDLEWEETWLTYKMSRPLGKMTMKELNTKPNLKRYADSLFYRNVGMESNRLNERGHQSASIIQHITSPTGGSGGGSMPQRKSPFGFLGKIF